MISQVHYNCSLHQSSPCWKKGKLFHWKCCTFFAFPPFVCPYLLISTSGHRPVALARASVSRVRQHRIAIALFIYSMKMWARRTIFSIPFHHPLPVSPPGPVYPLPRLRYLCIATYICTYIATVRPTDTMIMII